MNVHEIDICGVVFSGEDGPVSFSRIMGWYDAAQVRGSGDAIPDAHGSYERAKIFREARSITVEAGIEGDHGFRVGETSRIVSALTGQGEMRVLDESGVWVRHVEVQDVRVAESHALPYTEIVVDLLAPDPVRYTDLLTSGPAGLPVQVGGLVLPSAFPWDFGTATHPVATVVNDGKLPILPRVIVEGAADSIVVRGGPRRLEFGAFSGELVFDSRERRAWLDGVDVTRDLVRRDWPVVPAGVSQDFFFEAVDPSPDLELSVEYRIGVW